MSGGRFYATPGGGRSDKSTDYKTTVIKKEDIVLEPDKVLSEFYNKPKTYSKLGLEIGTLVEAKNAAYGDSFNKAGDILKILYPAGITPIQYKDMLAVVRIIDKLFRIASDKSAFNESPFKDIAGYGILGCSEKENKL
jgi:hypothetical protein